MEPRAHHVLIGAFTLVACLVAIVFALWLTRAHQQGKVDYYEVVFSEPVRGLSRGGAVLYNGIRIGEVVDLHLNPADLRSAHARIAINADIPVRQDTQARLTLIGITGVSAIELSGGSPLSPLLVQPAEGDPIIHATPSPLTQLLAGGDTLMTNLSELVLSARNILSPENTEKFGRSLEHLETVMASFAGQGDDVKALLQALTQTSAQVQDTLARMSVLVDTGTALLNDEGSATMEHARQAMASFERAAGELAGMINDNQAAVASGTRGLGELGPALQALRQTLQSIQEMMRRLDENPTAYLLGRERLPEFEP